MRKIKFRAWDIANNEMYQVGTLTFEKATGNLAEMLDPVMQFIGLLDKNGKEIYEGDVVKCQMAFNGGSLPHMGVIVYDETFGAFATKNEAGKTLLHNHLLNTFEVIGNIYENPELLEISPK